MTEETEKRVIHRGNSVISIEKVEKYPHPVVIKKPSKRHPSHRSLRALEKEYEITSSLGAVDGVRKVLEHQSIKNKPALILEYIDGETLRDHIEGKKLSLSKKLEIAVDLTRILGKIHRQDIIHLDLNSKNILIGNKQGAIHIIDFGSASRITGNTYQKVRPDQMLGTLPYISPEQTGRINRAVDERSDLYYLGVVLYEFMTGRLPFDSTNAMELIYRHIARIAEIPKRTLQMLRSYPWPGNVRELKHAVEGALITAQGKKLNFDLPQIIDTALTDFKSFEEMERAYILRVLKAKNWRIGGEDSAASTLGMPSSTLRSRMKKLGLKRP